MNQQIETVFEQQKLFFFTHQTKSIDFRIEQLKKLKKAILTYEERISDALWKDLHKSKQEAYMTEIGITLAEIGLHIRKLRKWAKPKRMPTNQMINFWSSSKIIHEPFGRVLIISPWNYPFQLLITPLIGAISAGNCAVLKPSEYSVNTAMVMEEMITEFFPGEYIKLFQGGKETNQKLLEYKWDYIFFTGSPAVGKVVMEVAAKYLTPVSLELGGKSPCIVDRDANLKIAAARIVWGKFINAGQTCIAPDYLFVHRSVKNELLALMKQKICEYFGENAKESADFPRIATVEKTERLSQFMKNETFFTGGVVDVPERYISPTILEVKPDHALMQEEIFGPILPVMEFDQLNEVTDYLNCHPKPLAFYYFSENRKNQKEIFMKTSSGGGCINDVLIHFSNDHMPFGGVGNSGIGGYHGKYSFETFSHKRSVMKKANFIDIPFRYPPFRDWKLKVIKMVLK